VDADQRQRLHAGVGAGEVQSGDPPALGHLEKEKEKQEKKKRKEK
jgi:hypothetical protein